MLLPPVFMQTWMWLCLSKFINSDACLDEILVCSITQPCYDSAYCDVQDLGWSQANTEALCAPSPSPAADAASASSKGKPTTAAKKPAAAGSADKTASATATDQIVSMTDEIVNGFQTPCHVAAVQGHTAAVGQLKADLTAAVSILKDSMYAWQQNEVANKGRWALCLKNMDDVV